MYQLNPCPFCGQEAKFMDTNLPRSYTYETQQIYKVECQNCGASTREVYVRCLADYTEYGVQDFRNNPALRARVEEDYEKFLAKLGLEVIHLWNKRVIKPEPPSTRYIKEHE